MLSFCQIEAFRATMETGSVSAASRLLYISQPSLSLLIADLESELGFCLFIRQRRGMKPTGEAQLFYREVERSYLGLRELETAAGEIRSFGRSRFYLGAAPGLALEFIPNVIRRFNDQYGPLRIAAHISTSDCILTHGHTLRSCFFSRDYSYCAHTYRSQRVIRETITLRYFNTS